MSSSSSSASSVLSFLLPSLPTNTAGSSSLTTQLTPSTLLTSRNVERWLSVLAVFYLFQKARKLKLSSLLSFIPGASAALKSHIDSETEKAVESMFPEALTKHQRLTIPEKGGQYEALLAEMKEYQQHDVKKGRVFGYMFDADDQAYQKYLEQAFIPFMHENGLNPVAFPALRKFEVEAVQMTLNMLNAPRQAVGNLTSGGTESLLLTVKTYRDRARALYGITEPEMILCHTAHVALPKAAAYFDVKCIWVDFDKDYQMRSDQVSKYINKNTICVVVSAPQYPHGIVDPVEEIASIARARNIPVHVDACMGGFLLPWVEKLGYEVPKWDFRVPGVTSISADVHKYGYAAKGASVLSWLNHDDYRQYQFYAFADWPGGIFCSPSLLGTRPGGSIAASWAAIVGMGQDGYLKKAEKLMIASKKFQEGINKIPGLRVLGKPHMAILAFESTDPAVNVFALADVMKKEYNWDVATQQKPNCLHLTLMPPHADHVDGFLNSLRAAVDYVRAHPELANEGNAATYGMVAKIPDDTVIEQFLVSFFGKVFTVNKK